jgi:hypothetical protein
VAGAGGLVGSTIGVVRRGGRRCVCGALSPLVSVVRRVSAVNRGLLL